jgi:hypothetical protein
MRYLLSLTLATLAALCVAGCVTPVPTASTYSIAQASGGPNCRRLAQPGDTKIQIYCQSASHSVWPFSPASVSEQPSSGTSCRELAEAVTTRITTYCGTAAEWDAFDTRAVNEGTTCRWTPGPRRSAGPPAQARELCLTAAHWQTFEQAVAANRRGRSAGAPGANWPGSGVPQGTSGSGFGASSSYGYFPAGGAIGQ